MDYEYTDTDDNGLTDSELHERFDEVLDEGYTLNDIAGIEFAASRVLRECDPIAYRCCFSDWLDAELQDGDVIEL
jgi:hypothetical protein